MSKPRRSTKAVDGGGGESEDKAKGNKLKSPKKDHLVLASKTLEI